MLSLLKYSFVSIENWEFAVQLCGAPPPFFNQDFERWLFVSPLPLVSYGGNGFVGRRPCFCFSDLGYWFFYPHVPRCFQTPVVFSKKIKETTLSCILCSLMIPWGLTPFWLWLYLHLACRSVPCDARSLASGQDEIETLISMYKSPHRILPVWGSWLKSM